MRRKSALLFGATMRNTKRVGRSSSSSSDGVLFRLFITAMMMMMVGEIFVAARGGKDFYKILGVDRQADERTLKKAYRREALENHPDKAGAIAMVLVSHDDTVRAAPFRTIPCLITVLKAILGKNHRSEGAVMSTVGRVLFYPLFIICGDVGFTLCYVMLVSEQ